MTHIWRCVSDVPVQRTCDPVEEMALEIPLTLVIFPGQTGTHDILVDRVPRQEEPISRVTGMRCSDQLFGIWSILCNEPCALVSQSPLAGSREYTGVRKRGGRELHNSHDLRTICFLKSFKPLEVLSNKGPSAKKGIMGFVRPYFGPCKPLMSNCRSLAPGIVYGTYPTKP